MNRSVYLSVEGSMKRDGRTLDHKTIEEMRRMAVQRVREGERGLGGDVS